jgi:hypothetical protein
MQTNTAQLLDNNKVERTLQAVQSDKYLQLMEDVINLIAAPKEQQQHVSLAAVSTVTVEQRALKGHKLSPQSGPHKSSNSSSKSNAQQNAAAASDQQDWADWQQLMSMQQLSRRFPPRGVWAQDEPAPCPYPPQFPPRQPFVQPLWEANARAARERPRTGLPAAELYTPAAAREAQQAQQLSMSVSAERLIVPTPTVLPSLRKGSPPRDGAGAAADQESGRVITVPKPLPAPNIQSITSLLTIGTSSFAPLILQSATATTLLTVGTAATSTSFAATDAAAGQEGTGDVSRQQQPQHKTVVQMRVPTLPAIARISQRQQTLEIPDEASGKDNDNDNVNVSAPQKSRRALSPVLSARGRHPDPLQTSEPSTKHAPVSTLPRYQDVPISVRDPPPFYQQRAEQQRAEESRRVRDSGFNFAPLVDALLKEKADEKANKASQEEATRLGMSSVASMRGGDF